MLTVVRMCGVNNNGDIKNEFPSLLTGFLTNQKRQAGAATVTWISCETILTFTKTHGSSYIHIVNFNGTVVGRLYQRELHGLTPPQ